MTILDKTAMGAVNDTEFDIVDVPEWSTPQMTAAGEVAQVRIRNLYGDQRQRLYGLENSHCWNALCCTMGIVDSQGAQIYNETSDAVALSRKHPEILERIARRICDISNMTKASRAAAEKKLRETPTNNGGSSSPEQSSTLSTSTVLSENIPAISSNAGLPTTT